MPCCDNKRESGTFFSFGTQLLFLGLFSHQLSLSQTAFPLLLLPYFFPANHLLHSKVNRRFSASVLPIIPLHLKLVFIDASSDYFANIVIRWGVDGPTSNNQMGFE